MQSGAYLIQLPISQVRKQISSHFCPVYFLSQMPSGPILRFRRKIAQIELSLQVIPRAYYELVAACRRAKFSLVRATGYFNADVWVPRKIGKPLPSIDDIVTISLGARYCIK